MWSSSACIQHRCRPCCFALAGGLAFLLPAAPAAAQSTNLVFTPVTPCRIINTVALGGPIPANSNRSFVVTGTTGFEAQGGLAGGCAIPTNATAVAINYVAVGPTGAGDFRAWPFGGSVPNASVVNYAAVGGLNVANGLVQPICNHATSTCTLDLTVRADVSAAFLVADVVGYFREISGTLTLNPDSGAALSTTADVDLRGRVMRGTTPFIQADTALFTTAIGESSLESNTTGYDNTAAGSRALRNNTTGVGNLAVGTLALQSNVAGSYNSAAGAYALAANSAGNENTATGYAALFRNTTGLHNTALGTGALSAGTTASDNTGLGWNALYSNVSGGNNTAVGRAALFSNINAGINTAVGSAALYANTYGQANTAVGSDALKANPSGLSNTAVGEASLTGLTAGDFNAALGVAALANLTTGNRNIAVGTGAGLNLTSGSSNIYIGNEGVPSESQTIRIGSGANPPHTRFFAAAVAGVNVGAGTQVFVSSTGQLGIVASSRALKDDIRDMDAASDGLLRLRPVSFRYKDPTPAGDRPLQYGLIAEEVAQVYPELVVYSDSGEPQSVQYHLLSSMLLNELQRQHKELQEMRARLARLEGRSPGQPNRLAERSGTASPPSTTSIAPME